MKTEFEKAVKRYNDLMFSVCQEHLTIGTDYSEHTENYTIKDMVHEAEYVLSTYYEDGHSNCDMRYSEEEHDRKIWRSETGKLKRFISAYKER